MSNRKIPTRKFSEPRLKKASAEPRKSWLARLSAVSTLLAAIGTFVAGAMTGVVAYVNNKEKLDTQWESMSSWFYKKDQWTGFLTDYPEYRVDMASLLLSDSEMKFALYASADGKIDGVVSDRRLCGVGFPNDFKLLRGEIGWFGKSAEVVVWDHIQGFPTDFARLTIKVDEMGVYTVKPDRTSTVLGNVSVRLAMSPDVNFESGAAKLSDFCAKEREALLSALRSRSPVDGHRHAIGDPEARMPVEKK